MYHGEYSWSLGVLIGVPILAIICVVLFVSTFLLGRYWHRSEGMDRDDGMVWFFVSLVCLLAVLIGTAIAYYPYSAEYHQWRTIDGRVAEVNKRLVGKDKGMEEKIVVKYADGGEYGCLDTRCALLKVGDNLSLSCKRVWQYAGTDGYDCNFIKIGA